MDAILGIQTSSTSSSSSSSSTPSVSSTSANPGNTGSGGVVSAAAIAPITRTHDENYNPEIAGTESIIKELTSEINKINEGNASRNQGKPIYSRKTWKSSELRKSFTQRAANKEEKDELSKWLVNALKNETLRTKVLGICILYGKVFSLSMAKNKALLRDAKEKAKEANFEPSFFATSMGKFLSEFSNVILPLMKQASDAGHALKFFTWGTLIEGFKDDLRDLIQDVFKKPESIRMLYSKIAAYGLTVDQASTASLRIIKSVCYIVASAEADGWITKEMVSNSKITNKDVIDKIKAFPNWKTIELNLTAEQITDAQANVFTGDFSLGKAAMIAAGIPPHWTMQSNEYKQASSGAIKKDVLIKTFRSVATNFNVIRTFYCAMTGQKVVYSTTKFKDCVRECYNMWRPMFVIARVMRSFYFPQAQFGVNENIDLADYVSIKDLNDDLDMANFFGVQNSTASP